MDRETRPTMDRPLDKQPLYRLQEQALQPTTAEGAAALAELGRRYASATTLSFKTDKHRAQVASQYVLGWLGEQDPYYWKGGNFVAPLRRAWSAGKRERADTAVAKAALDARKQG